MKIEDSRRTHQHAALLEGEIDANPLRQLRRWLDEANAQPSIIEPNAMCIATVRADGSPSARFVLLRGLDARGIIFYTSYLSRKGREIAENPKVSATFWWGALQRQVRIEGTAESLDESESDAYFASRPRGHQLAAWSSEQSEIIENRDTLFERMEHFEARFEGSDVPRPHSWGGYLVTPRSLEFWQGRPNRLHDRLRYELEGATWRITRLQP